MTMYNTYKIHCMNKYNIVEGMSGSLSNINNEALENIASLYNNKKLIIDEIEVGKITANDINLSNKMTASSAKIGNWEIKGKRIGIPGSSDLELGEDKWLRNYNYGTSDYAGTSNSNGGFAAQNMHCASGRLFANNVQIGTNNIISEDSSKRLQFHNNNKSIVSFPKDEHDPAVFRSTGLMYTNKQFSNGGDHVHNVRPTYYNVMKNDSDKHKNLVYLGGTTKDSANEHLSIINVRKHDNKWMAHQVKIHGHQPVCQMNCGSRDWNSSVI